MSNTGMDHRLIGEPVGKVQGPAILPPEICQTGRWRVRWLLLRSEGIPVRGYGKEMSAPCPEADIRSPWNGGAERATGLANITHDNE